MRRYPAAVLACALACAVAAPVAEAKNQQELGAPDGLGFTTPDCPQECQALAQVTGFQTRLGKTKNPFRIKRPGYITSFTLRLSKPNDEQIEFFKTTYNTEEFASGAPRVSLALLTKLEEGRFRLAKQTQAFNVERYLGSTPTFALRQPFRVKEDQVIALTTPTWVPAFSHFVPTQDNLRWRASYSEDDCTATSPPQSAHQDEGSSKQYGCFYKSARLLYTATFIGDPKPTNPAEKR